MGEQKKRRLSVWGSKNSNNNNDSDDAVELLEPNDDEMEKEKRGRVTIDPAVASSPIKTKNPNKTADLNNNNNSKRDTAKKRKSVGWGIHDKENHMVSQLTASTPTSTSTAHLSNDQLADLYSNCIKLCTENKINQKNSWQLNLIDYMEDVLTHQEGESDMTNFQAASCTLDASIRIYSCRVDSVHTDTYKVLGGLTRTGDRGEGASEGEDEEGEKETDADAERTGDTEKKKKPKKLPVGGVNTLEANVEALNAKKLDLEFLIDPLFRKTSAAFDEGGVKGLLLNHLSVHNVLHGCELVFDSVDAVDVDKSNSSSSDHSCDISDLQDLLAAGGDLRDIADLEICPTFNDFEFGQKGKAPKVELKDSEPLGEGGASEAEEDDFAGGMGGFDGGDIDFDDGGDDHDDGDGATTHRFDFNTKLDDVEQIVPGGVDPDMIVANDAWSDFQYLNPKFAKKWAGPDHWRFTSTKAVGKDGKGEGETKKRTKSEKKGKEFFIDFLAPPPPESAFAPPGRTLTTLSATVLKKASESSTTLPVDVHYDIKMLTQLFSKPKWSIPPVSKRFRKPSIIDDTEEGDKQAPENEPWYEYSNANDTSYVADNADDDDDHFGGGDFGSMDHDEDTKGEQGEGNAATVDFGTGLVAEPAKVAKLAINYAKVAKKVDVKALKTAIWTDLCDGKDEDKEKEKETETEKPKEKEKAKDKDKEAETFEGGRNFESLLSSVEERAGKEVGEVSVALCFICVLHLCNEKGLSLAQEGIEDLRIVSE